MNFSLSEKEYLKFRDWRIEVYKRGIELQKKKNTDEVTKEFHELGFPYSGAIGGQFTFSFTPTSIGVVCVVKDSITGEEIDLTDYTMW